ncbi:hypothetical protein CLV63_113140 [Murinocardiopsis flavida]|uniref:Uncharacterized protein n=1 Tax=Murinocardiopsis flavida TaxID=645275 RepID=A0A2P8DFK3_9ACTN|nr:SIMPL domain-containing protein [Murinocardiopsis flavida]PSK95977.1 hypothetical protein CLV63_113140 [Murinocardiopsis flavida]
MTESPTNTPASAAPVVRVRGVARMEVEPEIARFHVTVNSVGKDRRRTLERLTEHTAKIRERILGMGDAIEELTTGTFAVYPRRDRRKVERERAFDGSTRLHGTARDFTALGELLPWLAEQDMVLVSGPWRALRNGSPVHRQVRQQAVGAALERARDYAQALGADISGLVELADTGMSSAESRPRQQALSYGAAPAAPSGARSAPEELSIDLDPGTIEISAQLEATFEITAPTGLHG